MNNADRLNEAKRLILLAMDELSRVADATEGTRVGDEVEDIFEACQNVVEGLLEVQDNISLAPKF